MDQGKVVSRGEGSGEDVDDTLLSESLRYINLTEVTTGPVALCGLMHLCICVSEECGD